MCVQLAPHSWTVESLRNVGNGKEGPSSVARAPSSIFRCFATRPRCVHQLVTPGPPRPLLARGDGTECIGAAMVAFGSTTGTSHACFVTYAALHSTRASVRRPVLVAPLGCVHVRWLTSTTPDTTVHNGLQRFTTGTQPKPTRTRETSSQRFTTVLSSSSIHPLDCLANSPCVLLVRPRRAGALLLVFPCACAVQQQQQHRLAHVQLVVSSTDERGRDPTFRRRILLNHQCPPFQLLPMPRENSRP